MRFLVRKATRVLYFYHYLGNKLITFCSNALTNLNMTYMETRYKAFRGDIIRNLIITSKGFGFEIEVTAKVAKLKCAFYEVPISYYGRTYEEGKKITYRDGVALCVPPADLGPSRHRCRHRPWRDNCGETSSRTTSLRSRR